MPRHAIFVIALTFALTPARAGEIRVLVSNVSSTPDPAVGPGYVLRPAPHVDLNVVWHAAAREFTAGFRTADETPAVQYAWNEAIAYLPATGQRQRTSAAAQYDFQGALGDTYWVFPSSATASNNAYTLYVGLSAYGVARNGTFTNDRLIWTVDSVENLTTPSANAFYGYAVSAGTVNMQLTADPAYFGAQTTMLANGHTHLNLLFKAAGMYRVTFRVRGTLASTGEEVSNLLPVYFGIEQWRIPAATMSYNAWRDAEFSPLQAADPLVSGPEADPDKDGCTNLEEFAFGGDPLVPDAGLIAPRLGSAGDSRILTVRQRNDASGLTVTPLATESLQPGRADWRADLLAPHGQPRNVAAGLDEFDYLLDGRVTGRACLRVRTQLASP
jgi:surface-anchored protein